MAAEIPGIPYFARSLSSRASRTARSIGVALGTPRRRGPEGFAVLSGPGEDGTPPAAEGVDAADAVAAGESAAKALAAGELATAPPASAV
jgi:hypothetical protein